MAGMRAMGRLGGRIGWGQQLGVGAVGGSVRRAAVRRLLSRAALSGNAALGHRSSLVSRHFASEASRGEEGEGDDHHEVHIAADTTSAKGQVPESNSEKFTVQLAPESFKAFKCDPPSLELEVDKNQLIDMYTMMVRIRRMEMAADGLYKAKLIRGFCHLATGQEAVPVGMESAISKEDNVITAYRCHGFTLVRGGTVQAILAELLGRKEGMSFGKGGSMHMFAKNFFGGNGIVGAQIPVGAGVAFAQKYLKHPNTTFALYGDGASNQGQVFESFNMAKLWNLPCVFVCENNKYGMGTSAARSSASVKYYTRGDYIPGIQVNGMDVLAVQAACKFAKKWTVEDKNGPLVLEMVTYRYGGHSMSDPGTTYRSRDEIKQMRSAHDCITGLRTTLTDFGIQESELKSIDRKVRAEIDEAIELAKKSPEPPVEDLWKRIYVPGTEPPKMRGRWSEEWHHYTPETAS